MGWGLTQFVGSPSERQTFALHSALDNPKVMLFSKDNPLSIVTQVSVYWERIHQDTVRGKAPK